MENDQEIFVRQLKFATLFKILFWAGIVLWASVSLFVILLAFIDPSSVSMNGKPSTSTSDALLAAPLFMVIGSVLSVFMAALSAGLLRIFGRFLPMGQVEI